MNLDWSNITNTLINPTDIYGAFTGVPGLGGWTGLPLPVEGSFSDVTSWATDTAGLTDTGAGERGLEALQKGATAAEQKLNREMKPVLDMYKQAQRGRQMSDVLDTYRTGMMGTEGAGSAENVEQFLSPMYTRAIENATNQALGGAGSSLQSSAANKAVGTAVGNQVQNMWQQAFQNAMADAQNKQKVYTGVEQSDLTPSLNWAQLQSDLSGTKYTTGMDLAQAAGQVAGLNRSIFGNLF